ncbi:MAG: ATP-binding protein [Saccharofermentanales bacterium]
MHDLSLHLLDIVQNSIKAQASLVQVFIASNRTTDQITLTVVDDGKGMSPDQLALASDPFYTTRTTRSVGLGLPLLKELCEMDPPEAGFCLNPSRGREPDWKPGLVCRALIGHR